MAKHTPFVAAALLLALLVAACKNTPPGKPEKDLTYPFVKADSIHGFKGCEMAGFEALSNTERTFIYQNYLVKAKDREQVPGEDIEIVHLPDSTILRLPYDDASYFSGLAHGHCFVDVGTSPDARELVFFRIKPDGIAVVYRTKYYSDPAPFVSENGSIWFYAPIEESEMVKMPDCPDREKWIKDGLRVGYGQRIIYDLRDRMLTRKSEYVCVPIQ